MLMTVEELRKYITTDETDEVLAAKLSALELGIRRYTNNNFIVRGSRIAGDFIGGVFMSENLIPFDSGDTLMIAHSDLQADYLVTVDEVAGDTTFTVLEEVADEDNVHLYKVFYPIDLKLGAVEIMKWKLRNEAASTGNKAAMPIQSESLSRYSVTYAVDATESDIDVSFGVPRKYLSFLKYFKKARF